MKKIGVLYGREQDFTQSLIDNLNQKGNNLVQAESIKLGAFANNEKLNYDIIIDRASTYVPFYRTILKSIAIQGAYIINNPLLTVSDNKFFHYALAHNLDINTPKSCLIPTKEHPAGANSDFLHNLEYPLNWDKVFDTIGFPSVIRPVRCSLSPNEYTVYNRGEFFSAYDLTGNQQMMLQEKIDEDFCLKVFVIGKQDVRISNFFKQKPYHMRFEEGLPKLDKSLRNKIEDQAIKMCEALNLDFNMLEVTIKDNEIYFTELMNTIPNLDFEYIKSENYNWIINTYTNFILNVAGADNQRGNGDKTKRTRASRKAEVLA